VNTRLATALSGCAALALTLTACGGDDSGERTEEWAKNVCDQLQPQVERIQAANEAVAEVSAGDDAPADVQEVYSASYGELSAAFESLAEAVNGAGDPPVDDGETLRTDAVAELNRLSQSYAELRTASDELNTDDRAEFAEGLRGMAGQLEALSESGDDALSELNSGDLGEAMARQESCQSPVPAPTGDGEENEGDGADGEEGTDDGGGDDSGADDESGDEQDDDGEG
jgi:hypothetical protein